MYLKAMRSAHRSRRRSASHANGLARSWPELSFRHVSLEHPLQTHQRNAAARPEIASLWRAHAPNPERAPERRPLLHEGGVLEENRAEADEQLGGPPAWEKLKPW